MSILSSLFTPTLQANQDVPDFIQNDATGAGDYEAGSFGGTDYRKVSSCALPWESVVLILSGFVGRWWQRYRLGILGSDFWKYSLSIFDSNFFGGYLLLNSWISVISNVPWITRSLFFPNRVETAVTKQRRKNHGNWKYFWMRLLKVESIACLLPHMTLFFTWSLLWPIYYILIKIERCFLLLVWL